VSMISCKHRLILPGAYAGSPLLSQNEVWETLERYTREIARCDGATNRKRLALNTVRDCLGADLVYWHPGTSGEAAEVIGDHDVAADACHALTQKLLAETPGLDGQLLRSVLPSEFRGGAFQPHSAALVRVSQSHSIWMGALSMNARRSFQVTDLRIMTLIRQVLVNQRRHAELTSRMSDTLAWLVRCLTTSIDAHIPYAHGHSERVAKIAVEIGKRMTLPAPVLSDLYFAGLLHDIGITGVRQSLLLKPGKLTDDEFAQVKTYPIFGDDIMAGIKQLAHLRPAVRHHHERFDGAGYPDGLAGDRIPLMARILAVADGVDAMLSARPHRPALPGAEVEAILADGAGRQWDPCVVKTYLVCRPHLQAICEKPSQSQASSAFRYAVEAWNVDSSQHAAACGTGPPPPPTPAGRPEAFLP
jgi:HD-GYP domain-containing protein (c-di-GMP phosphodiesterase class II)